MLESFSISIVIPTLHNPYGVELLLDSIKRCYLPSKFEVLVVSNFFDENTKKATETYHFAKYLYTDVKGANFARNLGVKKAQYDFIYFFDDDCVIEDKSFFEKLADLSTNLKEEMYLIGGVYDTHAEAKSASWAYNEIQNSWLQAGRINNRNGNAYLIGGNCGGIKSVFLDNPFDESFIYGGTETELFLRLYQKGYKIFKFDQIRILHNTQLNLTSLIEKSYGQAQGLLRIEKKGLGFNPVYTSVPLENSFYIQIYKMVFKVVINFNSSNAVLRTLKSSMANQFLRLTSIWQSLFYKLANLIEVVILKK